MSNALKGRVRESRAFVYVGVLLYYSDHGRMINTDGKDFMQKNTSRHIHKRDFFFSDFPIKRKLTFLSRHKLYTKKAVHGSVALLCLQFNIHGRTTFIDLRS